MAGGSSGGQSLSLQYTPTWALATVCFVFISFSIFVEHLIHLLSNWLKRHRKAALFEAVEKLKSVLMLLGFMSLILAVTQRPISRICIPTKVGQTMLPCRKSSSTKTTKALGLISRPWTSSAAAAQNSLSMKDVFEDFYLGSERRLAESSSSTSDYCESQGKTSFMSQDGINQLNNFIFVLAIMQIVYSVLTMALGRAKMRRWKSWEMETQTVEYQVANDPNRFRFTRQTTFGRRHMNSCAKTSILLWIKCFFRQFFHSVAKVDYLTLRHGFISMVLVLGTKLEVIVAKMALKLQNQHSVVAGTPLVEPNDDLFWFGHPKFVLTLLHFTLFMNAFELAFFVWVTVQYGIRSCYHEHKGIIIIRVVLAVTVQIMCSYITLPLYALVTQMGSNFKRAVLEGETMNIIRQWHSEVKEKRKRQDFSQYSYAHDPSSTTVDSSVTSSSSPDISSHRRPRPQTFGEITSFSSETEIDHQKHQEISQNEFQQVVVSSSPVDIEMAAEVGQHQNLN
ncbi:MLO-like protein 3 isoform X2 [Ziziphus jujuba]|uniref:MLO-like protein n=1 Tax=Ziziphus jujuba TaxID=326968 RepID=A0ABM3ZUX8_ZIZJJ|nr:MLO-like protein 3 isoform X2 [Ziziphus jujuba]